MSAESNEEQFAEFETPWISAASGEVVHEGTEVYVEGIGNKFLGIGRFAGGLVLWDANGREDIRPVVEVQERLLGGIDIGFWSTAPDLIELHRLTPVVPIEEYLEEHDRKIKRITAIIDKGMADMMGIAWE